MRFLFLWAAFGLLSSCYAQTRLSGQITSTNAPQTLFINVPFDCWKHAVNTREIRLDAAGRFSLDLPIYRPQILFLTYAGKSLHLYVEPRKELSLRADSTLAFIRFGGSLGRENTIRKQLGLTFNTLGETDFTDSLRTPELLLADLRTAQQWGFSVLKKWPFKPSAAFLRMTTSDLHFFAASKLWEIFWRRGIGSTRPLPSHRDEDWRSVLRDVYRTLNLSDEQALSSYHYQTVVTYYPRWLQYQAASPEDMQSMLEAVLHKPMEQARQELRQKGKCYWEYAAFEYRLKGPSLERALASFLINGMHQGDFNYKSEAYETFVKRYPKSAYRRPIEAVMQPYFSTLRSTQPQDIHFVTARKSISMLDSLIRPYRGKVLYIDLWGSWCSPCRQEMLYAQALKDRFQDKPIVFLYIAVEHGSQPEKRWRELIDYYQLKGHHVLAGPELENDLKKIYAFQGSLQFPSYILVDQSGKIVTLQAKRPSQKQALYEQIQSLL